MEEKEVLKDQIRLEEEEGYSVSCSSSEAYREDEEKKE